MFVNMRAGDGGVAVRANGGASAPRHEPGREAVDVVADAAIRFAASSAMGEPGRKLRGDVRMALPAGSRSAPVFNTSVFNTPVLNAPVLNTLAQRASFL